MTDTGVWFGLLAVAFIVLAVALGAVVHAGRSGLRSHLREQVVVTLKTGEAFRGLLMVTDGRVWELADATALGAGDRGADVKIDGRLILPADNIAYCQRP